MAFEIKKVYTDNPYVDELVYYTKQLGLGTVLKLQNLADSCETVESLKNAGLYISCVEGTAIFSIFDKVSVTALNAVGIIAPELVKSCLEDKNNVPANKRNAITKVLMQEYIDSYEELNNYYRCLNGLPPIGRVDYVDSWIVPEGVVIDLSKPVHEMGNAEASILEKYGIIDEMIEEDPDNRQYMRHLGKKKIDIYFARRAMRFDPLYVPTCESEAVQHMYRERLDQNKFYTLRTVYSEAFAYNSDYYDNFIAVFIVLMTMIDIISRVQEFIARKEIFDIRSCEYLFKSYGVKFFPEIPLKYQIAMVKNLHTLLKYKSTAQCMTDICSLFGFKNIKIFKYYLLRDRKVDLATGDYVYALDEDGNEDLETEYELKFLKLPIDEDLDDYIRVGGNYVDYDEITYGDAKWDGGLDHNSIMKEILKEEFNFTRTKYISIDTIYDIAKMSIQQTYFFNMLYDNMDLENLATIKVPYIEAGKEFKVADIFTLLTVLTHYYYGYSDTIMDTQSKVLYVNGFNFKADLAALAEAIGPKKLNNTVVDPGSTLHAQEQLAAFQIPTSSIPSMGELMDMYINNMNVREELVQGMIDADNKRVYDVYKMLYDALCTVELTFDMYKNPETGDFYRDENGDATYSEYLKHKDASLHYIITIVQEFEDKDSRNQYIANLIDSIVYALEEFIDSDEFEGLFYALPVVSAEAVKQYVSMVINFYKSYKVDFLGMNTVYTYDDKGDGAIRLIDDLELNRFFQKNEFVKLYERFAKATATMNYQEKIHLVERIYLDISTWIHLHIDDKTNVHDEIYELLTRLVLHSIAKIDEEITSTETKQTLRDLLNVYDFMTMNINMTKKDDLGIYDIVWIYPEGTDFDASPYMSRLYNAEGSIVTANAGGNSAQGPTITNAIDAAMASSNVVVTEEAVANYVDDVTLTIAGTEIVTDLADTIDEASDKAVASEKSVVDALTFQRYEPTE